MKGDCPDCGIPLNNGVCHSCGHYEVPPQIGATDNHRRCSYRYYQDQCPLPGTMTDTSKPDMETPFYCHHHMAERANPKKSAFIYHEILKGNLTGHRGSDLIDILNEKMSDLRKTNPELFYLPGTPEESVDYQKMIMAYTKSISFNKLTLPYNKRDTLADVRNDADESILTGREIKL